MRTNPVGTEGTRILRAIAASQVTRDTADGTRPGMWALYLLEGEEVGMAVRRLRKLCLVDAPMIGPPTITPDGAKLLRELLD